MWQNALDYLSKNGSPYDYTHLREGKLDLAFAKTLTEHWKKAFLSHTAGFPSSDT